MVFFFFTVDGFLNYLRTRPSTNHFGYIDAKSQKMHISRCDIPGNKDNLFNSNLNYLIFFERFFTLA